MTEFAKRDLIHASDFVTLLMSYHTKIFSPIRAMIGQSCCQISKLYMGQTQAELHILKVEKLDVCVCVCVCVRPVFADSVTYR